MSSFHRILVGWDGSRDAQQALWTATDLAEGIGAEVVVLAALKRRSPAGAVRQADEEMMVRRLHVVADIEARTARGSLRPKVHLRSEVVESDDPALTLRDHVKKRGFDLVVVGRHGREDESPLHADGVIEEMLLHSPCPVLVVGGCSG